MSRLGGFNLEVKILSEIPPKNMDGIWLNFIEWSKNADLSELGHLELS